VVRDHQPRRGPALGGEATRVGTFSEQVWVLSDERHHLAGDTLDECRRRVQQDTRGHRGRKGDPLYADRRTLHTGAGLLTDKQQQRLGRCSPSTIMSRRAAGSTSA